MSNKPSIQLNVGLSSIPRKMLVTISTSVVMAASNCMTLSSDKQQQHKSTLNSYASEIVVPTTNKYRWQN